MQKFAIRRRGSTFASVVKTFQIHCHSKRAVNIKIVNVVSSLDVFLTTKTIIAIPLQHTLNQVDDFGILSQVKKYVDYNLDPNSKSFSNDLSILEILSNMGITEDDCY